MIPAVCILCNWGLANGVLVCDRCGTSQGKVVKSKEMTSATGSMEAIHHEVNTDESTTNAAAHAYLFCEPLGESELGVQDDSKSTACVSEIDFVR